MSGPAPTAFVTPRYAQPTLRPANDAGGGREAASPAALREAVQRLERSGGPGRMGLEAAVPLGVAEIDALLPRGGLSTGALHEVETGAPATAIDVHPKSANPEVASLHILFPSYLPPEGEGAPQERMGDVSTPRVVVAETSPIRPLRGRLPPVGEGNLRARSLLLPHDGAATAFAARMLGRFSTAARARSASGDLLWIRRPSGPFDAPPYAPGLATLLDPARLVLVTVRREEDLLWAMEEALRTPSLAAVLGETADADLTATRRLQLAAERSGVPAVLLRPTTAWSAGRSATRKPTTTAAMTRWRVAAAESISTADLDDVGAPRWRVELRRNRHGAPLSDPFPSWLVETNDETDDLCVVPAAVDRPAVAPHARIDDARLAV